MSSNQQSAIGKIGYRALNGAEVKEIIIGELANSIRDNKTIKRFLTFHSFKVRYGYQIIALADTPVPPEVDKFFEITVNGFSDEELAKLKGDILALENKLAELQPLINRIEIAKKYLAEVKIEAVEKDVVSDNRQPDILRQKHNLPVLQAQRVGPQIAEVPIQQVPERKPEFVTEMTVSNSPEPNNTEGKNQIFHDSGKDIDLNV